MHHLESSPWMTLPHPDLLHPGAWPLWTQSTCSLTLTFTYGQNTLEREGGEENAGVYSSAPSWKSQCLSGGPLHSGLVSLGVLGEHPPLAPAGQGRAGNCCTILCGSPTAHPHAYRWRLSQATLLPAHFRKAQSDLSLFLFQGSLAGKALPHSPCWSGWRNTDSKMTIKLRLIAWPSLCLPGLRVGSLYSLRFHPTPQPTKDVGPMTGTLHLAIQGRAGPWKIQNAIPSGNLLIWLVQMSSRIFKNTFSKCIPVVFICFKNPLRRKIQLALPSFHCLWGLRLPKTDRAKPDWWTTNFTPSS